MLYIPFSGNYAIGGPSTFLMNLQAYLDSVNFPYSANAKKAKSIFFPISFQLETLNRIRKNGGKIIQRLDGVYYHKKHKDYEIQNLYIKDIYQQYSDFIVFQSEYSKRQCFAMFGEIPSTRYDIIINGADEKYFYPTFDHEFNKKNIKFVTTGNFRNLDMIEPMILALDDLAAEYSFELSIIGPIAQSLTKFLNRSYVKHTPSLGLQEIGNELRKNDIFIYSHLNPPCPNSVIEAVSCGLPVVGFDSGSMKEILHFNTEILAAVSENIFQGYEEFKHQRLFEKLEYSVNHFESIKNQAMAHAKDYTLTKMGEKYTKCFDKILRN